MTNTNPKASIPWHARTIPNPLGESTHIRDDNNGIVARVESADPKAIAAFIVRAANSHIELLEALEATLTFLESHAGGSDKKTRLLDQARAAITLATEEPQ